MFGCKDRLSKNEPIFAALGSLDELNSWLGFCVVTARADKNKEIKNIIAKILITLQENLFIIQAQLAGAPKNISVQKINELEKTINNLATKIKPRKSFTIPGGSQLSALLDFARAMARRTERAVLTAQPKDEVKAYLNRLSSILYVLARRVNDLKKIKEQAPKY